MKSNKKILIFSLFLIFLFCINTVYAEDIEDNTITHANNNETIILNDVSGTYTELKTLIDNANSGDTITLDKNYTYNTANDNSLAATGILINKELTIDGNGYTLNGNNMIRLFDIKSDSVTIKNTIIINHFIAFNEDAYDYETGDIDYELVGGAAIYWKGDYGTILNSTFTNNNGEDAGGAIFWAGDKGKIINSTFTNNTAALQGGVIELYEADENNILGNTFIDNTGDYGGAICLHDSSSKNNIEYNIFINSKDYYGYAVNTDNNDNQDNSLNNNWWGSNTPDFKYFEQYITDFAPNTWIIMKFTTDNEFSTTGGENTLTVSLNTIYDKISKTYLEFDEYILNRTVTYTSNTGSLNPTSTDFKETTTTTFTYPASETITVTATVDNQSLTLTNINNHDSFTDLNQLIEELTGTELTLTKNYTFDLNKDLPFLEGITIDKQLTLKGDNYTINGLNKARIFQITASNVEIDNTNLINGYNSVNGGAIYWNGANGVLKNSLISNSTAFRGAGIYSNERYLNIINSTLTYNHAEKDGGAIYFNSHYMNIFNSTFINNSAVYYGGAINTISLSSNITNSTFINNTGGICGGALYLYDFKGGTVTDNTFTDNHADNGAALCLGGDADSINITHNALVNNTDFYGNIGVGTFANSFTNINLNENWWGENRPTFQYFTDFVPDLMPETWVTLKLKRDGEFVAEGGDITLIATLNTLYNNTNSVYTDFTSTIPERIVKFNATYGTLNPETATITNQASVTYTYPGNTNLIISAIVDNQEVFLTNYEPIDSFIALQRLIDAATEGTELNLKLNYTYNPIFDTDYTYGVSINKKLTLNGNDTVLNGINLARIFQVVADDVIINNIIFINGTSSDKGGAIYWMGANGILNNSLFENNTGVYGGAVNWQGTNGEIINTTFQHNTANSGGAIVWEGEKGIINSSTFKENEADNGGALNWPGAEGILTNSIFTENTATTGGAVNWAGENGLIDNITFANNTAYVSGGAVTWSATENGLIINSTFLSNNAGNNGGAVFESSGNVTIIDSLFKQNHAENGGACYWSFAKNGTIINSTFINNTAEEGGALLWFYADDGLIINSTFIENNATVDGGAIQVIISKNFKTDNNTFTKNDAKNTGGAIFLASRNDMIAYILNNNFQQNTAKSGGAIDCLDILGIIENNTFTNNTASNFGGAVYVEAGTLEYNLTNNTFTSNTANRGGGLYLSGSNYTACVDSSNFYDNYASDYGGGLINFNTKTNILNSNFINNTSPRGGGLVCSGDGTYVNNSTFINNTATVNGGAIFWNNKNGTLANSTFINNTALSNGGAIYWNGADSTLTNLNFIKNTASNGGALILNGENAKLKNANFTNNTATSNGGAIYINKNNMGLTDTNFTSNTAESGSAIYNSGENININNIILTENHANSRALLINNTGISYIATLIGGNNILNGIYNLRSANNIIINGTQVVSGAENSNNGALIYQDNREYNQPINLLLYNNNNLLTNATLTTDIYGSVKYTPYTGNKINFTHYNNTYYSEISNSTNINSDNTYSSLWRLITNAIENDITEITLTKDYTYSKTKDTDYPENGIEINKNLKINGNGHTLNGLNTAKLFTLTDSNLNLNNINIINHKSTNGGAINSENSNITIFNSTIRNNTATGNGGFIYSTSTKESNLNISNSIITNNTATEGNTIYAIGNVNIITDNNWWGNNTPFDNTNYNKQVYDKIAYTKPNNWFVMNFTKPGDSFKTGDTLTLTTSLNTIYTESTDTLSPASINLPTSTVTYSGGYTGNSRFTNYTNLNFPTTSAGEYTVNAKIDNMILSLNFTINQSYIPPAPPIPVTTINITIPNITGKVNEKVTIPVTVYNSNNIAQKGTITIIFNNNTISSELTNGIANINLTLPQTNGTYTILGIYNDTYMGRGYATVEGEETHNETIIINIDNTLYPSNSKTDIIVNVTYSNGTLVNSGNITLTINGSTYQNPVENGVATFNIQTPTFGYYNVTTTYNNQSTQTTEFTIGYVETVLNVTDLIKIYGTDEEFTGYLLDTNGNPIIGHHLNLKLTRLSSGANKVYDVVTDYNGKFNLPINLAIGLYTADIEYNGLGRENWKYSPSNASANIQVTNTNDTRTVTILTTEKFREPYLAGKSFTGTLKSINDNPIAGHHISVTLTRLSSGASKTYDVVSDYRGIFNLAINLAPGEYTGVCTYSGTTIYQPSSSANTITVY